METENIFANKIMLKLPFGFKIGKSTYIFLVAQSLNM